MDEAHLLSAEKLELLLECVKEQPVIFSSDVEDMISSKEIDRRGTHRIEHLPEIQIFSPDKPDPGQCRGIFFYSEYDASANWEKSERLPTY